VLERERDGGPVVGVACGDPRHCGVAVFLGPRRGSPVDRYRGERREHQREVESALLGEPWDVAGDLRRDGVCSVASERNISLARSQKSRTVTTFMWAPWLVTENS
jgi:hypothetical protein